MRNILFTKPADEKILAGEKSLTARYWKKPWVKVGDRVTASTGYPSSTRFAVLRITGFWWWDGDPDGIDAHVSTGLPLAEIAKREGFDRWRDFVETYGSLNAERFKDKGKHYFIAFELVGKLSPNGCGIIELATKSETRIS